MNESNIDKNKLSIELTEALTVYQLLEITLRNYVNSMQKYINFRTEGVLNFKGKKLDRLSLGQLEKILAELDDGSDLISKVKKAAERRNKVAHAAFANLILNKERELNEINSNIASWKADAMSLIADLVKSSLVLDKTHKESLSKKIEESEISIEAREGLLERLLNI